MPDNIISATPTDVLPAALCAAFQEELRYECFVNAYQDGRSDRLALSIDARRFWKMTRLVTPALYSDLYIFYSQHLIKPFWFYNPFETIPPFSWSSDGSAPDGRYAAVFDGSWSEELRLGRAHVSFGLREVL